MINPRTMKAGRILFSWLTAFLFVSGIASFRLLSTNRPVCPMMPMQSAIGKQGLPACCQGHSAGLQSILRNCCCCDFTAAPERSEPAAMLPVFAAVATVPLAWMILPAPPVVATSLTRLPVFDEDAPRGPPPIALSPRAPPAVS